VLRFGLGLDVHAIVAVAHAAGWHAGDIARPDAVDAHASDVRQCGVSTGVPPLVRAEIERFVVAVAHGAYGFEVDGLRADDPLLVMRYAVGDHFTWHVDNGLADAPMGSRKLSFTFQLSDGEDYDGGDLELATYAQAYLGEGSGAARAALRERGTLIVFPAFMLHRVTPVTRGTRYALVGWVHGPAFR